MLERSSTLESCPADLADDFLYIPTIASPKVSEESVLNMSRTALEYLGASAGAEIQSAPCQQYSRWEKQSKLSSWTCR